MLNGLDMIQLSLNIWRSGKMKKQGEIVLKYGGSQGKEQSIAWCRSGGRRTPKESKGLIKHENALMNEREGKIKGGLAADSWRGGWAVRITCSQNNQPTSLPPSLLSFKAKSVHFHSVTNYYY